MTFAALAWLVVGAHFTLATLLLLRVGRKPSDPAGPVPLTLADAALAACATGALLVLEVLAGLTRNPFGLIRLVYLHGVVLAPALALLALILAAWRKNGRRPFALSRAVTTLAILTLTVIPVGVYATFIEPFRLQLETATVVTRAGRDPGGEIRIAVLADIQTNHVGEHERRAVELALAQHPDIILLPGDLWQSEHLPTPDDVAALRDLLGRLHAPGGVWFVQGNCDSPAWIADLLAGTPVSMLYNRVVRVHVQGHQITIGGVELEHTYAAATIIRELETAPGSGDLRILLAHYPDNIRYLHPDSRIDLVVAGHTHGGQVVIPGLGPPMTLTRVPRTVAAGGLHRLNGNAIYVSRGVGCERGKAPRIRFFCPPEVSLITIPATPKTN